MKSKACSGGKFRQRMLQSLVPNAAARQYVLSCVPRRENGNAALSSDSPLLGGRHHLEGASWENPKGNRGKIPLHAGCSRQLALGVEGLCWKCTDCTHGQVQCLQSWEEHPMAWAIPLCGNFLHRDITTILAVTSPCRLVGCCAAGIASGQAQHPQKPKARPGSVVGEAGVMATESAAAAAAEIQPAALNLEAVIGFNGEAVKGMAGVSTSAPLAVVNRRASPQWSCGPP